VKRASITEAKNRLSALIDYVRHGETVVIEDRGVPVARLESVLTGGDAEDGRLARLERQGLIRRPSSAFPKKVISEGPPKPVAGARLSEALLNERGDGR
jgi:prevent-host-death family protein